MDDGLYAGHGLPAGLHRSDVHVPGIRRVARDRSFAYIDPVGGEIVDPEVLNRIKALAIPPAWHDVWISPDPLGHIQAMGRDSRGRRQYRYHALWRAERDAEKFGHMLLFAQALPRVRGVADEHLARRYLDRERVSACAIRVTELGLFRIGTERYAREDHTYGVASLERQHVSFRAGAAVFDYVAKHGRRRTVSIADPAAVHTLRALQRAFVDVSQLFVYRVGRGWRRLTSGELVSYLRTYAGGHFMVKEFRTWNATLLAALALSGAGSTDSLRTRRRAVVGAVREASAWLGDTPAVARASYIDPAVIELYESTGSVGGLGPSPVQLPAHPDAEREVLHALLEQHASRGERLGE
jgi:DNA topoisomerase IB